MKIFIAGQGPLGEQAIRLTQAAGYAVVADAASADYILPVAYDETLPTDKLLADMDAWALTNSRLASDAFLQARGFPVPAYFPGGSEPYIVKPDKGGGGRGIWVTEDFCEVGGAVNAGFVAQEELPGDVWSAVVTGRPGAYTAHPPVRLIFRERKRTGAELAPAPEGDALRQLATDIAQTLELRGILEVEAIWSRNAWWVTDLNARLPLFTPDTLETNLLTELVRAFS